jgi:hypothetical protein
MYSLRSRACYAFSRLFNGRYITMTKLKEYKVYASETVFYEIPVKAKSIKEAEDLIMNGEIDFGQDEIEDSEGFEIERIELDE